MKRLITLVRVLDDRKLSKLFNRSNWYEDEELVDVNEWSDSKINRMITTNESFRRGIVNLFFEGATVPFLVKTLPLFELKKLSIQKLSFTIPEMIDTLVRYKEKGSYAGKGKNNPERIIEDLLGELDITFETGDLTELIAKAPTSKRAMDFIIPDIQDPKIIIECSYLTTTSSGQGDKSKTEIAICDLIQQHYPKTHFIGFIDGIGWYVRKNDLKRMVTAYADVFTFHIDELKRFRRFVKGVMFNEI